jgi:hypothetical protein
MINEPTNGQTRTLSLYDDINAAGLLRLEPGERLWKVWVFRPAAGRASRLEHRIYAIQKPGGQLAMITFAVHAPNGTQPARSNIARVTSISPQDLERIITAIRQQAQAEDDDYEEIDLSRMATLDEQLDYLRDR